MGSKLCNILVRFYLSRPDPVVPGAGPHRTPEIAFQIMSQASDAIVYFNGRYIPKRDVRISPDDRGFLFADGIYEVIRAYDGRLFETDAHLRRLENSLRALRIQGVDPAIFPDVATRLLEANDLSDAALYIQVTRGEAPRKHAFPEPDVPATVYATVYTPKIDPRKWDEGVRVILVPDVRWARCDIKTIALPPNVLASQRAKEADVEEAVFVRDGVLTEGSHTNVCAILDGTLVTYPLSNYILPGVTRAVVLDLCRRLGVPYREAPIYESDLDAIDELMILGTTTEVMPVVQVDHRTIADGRPGPVTLQLQQAFRRRAKGE